VVVCRHTSWRRHTFDWSVSFLMKFWLYLVFKKLWIISCVDGLFYQKISNTHGFLRAFHHLTCTESCQTAGFTFSLVTNLTVHCAIAEGTTCSLIMITTDRKQVDTQWYIIMVADIPSLTTSKVILAWEKKSGLYLKSPYFYTWYLSFYLLSWKFLKS
jgi:hypothetical protein